MRTDHTEPFRVGVTADVRGADGSFALDPRGLPLLAVPGLVWEFLDHDARELTPDLLERLDALFHFSPVVSAASLEGVDRLALIARSGVGLDFIDLDACTARGIAVTITPRSVTRPMASAAVAFVLALSHRLVERDRALHEGRWTEGRFDLLGRGLTGRTLGVIGYGRIGREVARLLRPWEMEVVVATRTPPSDGDVETVELEELLDRSDVVVVACPLTPETHHLLDAQRLARMRPGALLVNVARGAIVDQSALADAIREGRLGGAGLDVFDPEPIAPDDPLLALPTVIGAPHALGYWDQLFSGCVAEACEAILAVSRGEVPADVVNRPVLAEARFLEKLHRFERSRT